MKKLVATGSMVLLLTAMLTSSPGCSKNVSVLRGSEEIFKVKRSFQKPTLLYVDLAKGQEATGVHHEGWYVSPAYMSRIYELLGERENAK